MKRVVFLTLTSVAILLVLLTGLPSAYASTSSASHTLQQMPTANGQAVVRQPKNRSQSSAPGIKGGKLKWRYQTGGAVYSSPAVANGVVYIGSNDDSIYAFNASNGTLVWSYATGGNVVSWPEVVNGVVYVGSEDNYVYALKASRGTLLWSYQTGGQVSTTAVLYVGSLGQYIYALSA